MSRADEVLGSAPQSWSTLHADLIRLRRFYDKDDEERQASSFHSNQLDSARIQLIDSLLAHIQPTVSDEKALWDRIDRDLQQAKDERSQPRPHGWRP